MIFVTVGTQLPFPRLVKAMDSFSSLINEEVVAQVGPDRSSYSNLKIKYHLSPKEFDSYFNLARVIVAHAGIGTVLTAKKCRKPLVLVPRRFTLGEHRNDHQLATARELANRDGIYIAWQAEDIVEVLEREEFRSPSLDAGPSYRALTTFLRETIDQL